MPTYVDAGPSEGPDGLASVLPLLTMQLISVTTSYVILFVMQPTDQQPLPIWSFLLK